MPLSKPVRRGRSLALAVAVMATLSGIHPDPAAAADAFPARVAASYDVNFNGINVGSFEFSSTTDGQNYALVSNAKLSLLLGAFKWHGNSNASGRIVSGQARPAGFTFDYKGNNKSGATKLGFTDDTVTSVVNLPQKPPKDGTVPVLPQHLKGVFDPMSAILAVSKGSSETPCGRRIPIFDGKARFDLVLLARGTTPLSEQRPSGQPGTGYVCRVKYVPIAGHKADEESKYMSSTDGIEIVFRPIPAANVFVPYRITIPTIAGPATIVSRRVDITTSQQQQIALVH